MSKEESLETIARALAQQNCILNGIFQIMALRTTGEFPNLEKHIIDLMKETFKTIEAIRNK